MNRKNDRSAVAAPPELSQSKHLIL
jgi:hypothetical protein